MATARINHAVDMNLYVRSMYNRLETIKVREKKWLNGL